MTAMFDLFEDCYERHPVQHQYANRCNPKQRLVR